MVGLLEPGHLILILLAALLVFGPRQLPELGRGLGGALREFRKGTPGLKEEFDDSLKDEGGPAPQVRPAVQVRHGVSDVNTSAPEETPQV